ncbi:Uncharacterized conserved protein GlcG, DUF336 family [Sphingopyxis flava]|uniref:Uncharacterized conserved protein GlcG, DUF336 family n=2 Tax=Sphingopyxis flava TaxID=1507287 RepID=A0A1T5FFE8_9SPHN|nr:heme-binding protein [Sphingopyxis flava]SKB94889.1 Uncharacterized conserved protein GlcG, DUF336 family [Sphingopyxis flava]
MSRISLDQAQAIVAGALKEGRAMNLKPLTVAVLDAGGHVVALAREDGSSNLRPQVATGKAAGALALGMSSRAIGEMAEQRPMLISAAGALSPAGLIPVAGGVLIQGAGGELVGAVGVTGDLSDNDEKVALAGIAEAGLTAKA